MALEPVVHSLTRTAGSPVGRLFDTVVAEDVLPKVLRRYWLVPAVIGTSDLTGPWDAPGSARTVHLANGTSSREQVLSWERPSDFSYRVERFPRPLGLLATHAVGRWTFTGDAAGSEFAWSYAFHPRNAASRPLLAAFVALMWSGYMEQCADACVALAGSADPA